MTVDIYSKWLLQIFPKTFVLIANDSVITGMLSELSTVLDELQHFVAKIADLKKEILEREEAVLKAILEALLCYEAAANASE